MNQGLVVIGRQGQVAQALARAAQAAGLPLAVLGRPELALERPESIAPAFAALPFRPALVVNAAAHTAVDRAEDEPDLAFAVNGLAPGLLAAEAAKLGAAFVHFSTDYVFDGRLGRPYREDDATHPLGVYGASKLAGEAAVRAATPRHAILRTAWVCSTEGSNFLRTMLRLSTREELGVVADQLGAPSFAEDLAAAVLRPAAAGRPVPRLRAITTAEYPTRAARPADGRLDCGRIAAMHGIQAPDWRQGLDRALARLLAQG